MPHEKDDAHAKEKDGAQSHDGAAHAKPGAAAPEKDRVKVAAAKKRRPPSTLEDVLTMSYAEVLEYPTKYVAGTMPPQNGAEVGAPTDGAKYNELQAILRGPLQSNWFFAKDVLLKGKGGKVTNDAGQQVDPDQDALRNLMWRLIGMREYAFNKSLADVRDKEGVQKFPSEKKGDVLSWTYAGSESATSDVDVNLKGKFNGQAVGAFNQKFRAQWGIESGMGFDVNVYALDFMHGFNQKVEEKDGKKTLHIAPTVEKDLPLQDAKKKDQDVADQETWSLVHVLRYMQGGVKGGEWTEYKRTTLEGAGARRAQMAAKFSVAESRFTSYEASLHNMTEIVREESTAALASVNRIQLAAKERERSVGDKHEQQKAFEMRAANRLYEQKVEIVIHMRGELEKQLAAHPRNDEAIEKTMLMLRAHISDALMYANEAYLTDGAVNHVVVGMQIGSKLKAKHGADDVKVQLTEEQFLHSFNEQMGDALKECNHYEAHFAAACYKGGKYIDRMVKAAKQLHGAEADGNLEGLRLLGEKSVTEKAAATEAPDTDARVRPAAKGGTTPEAACAAEATRALGVRTTAELRAKVIATGTNVPILFRKAQGGAAAEHVAEAPKGPAVVPPSTGAPDKSDQALKQVTSAEVAKGQAAVAKIDPHHIEQPGKNLKGQS